MGMDADVRPKLRQLDPVALVLDGKAVIGLKDPLRLSARMLCVTDEAIPVLAMLDGRHSLRDIQELLTRETGQLVMIGDIQAVVDQLDEALLLEGERFRTAYQIRVDDYRKQPFRPCSHAGTSYSADPEALRKELRGFFESDGGPGMPDLFSGQGRPVGLIAPHIDIRAGGRCFARAYHALGAGEPSDLYVILGTGHSGVEGMFTATSLDFQTPLGTVQTDRQMLDLLSQELGKDAASEEILHATEHVIEFQLVFLQFLMSETHRFTVLPILCSLSHHIFGNDGITSGYRERFHDFCAALKEAARKTSKSVCFIASADLDHIGPRYGDRSVPHSGTVRESLAQDEKLLQCLERLDVNAFISQVARDNDSRRVCGFSPITTMLHCMEASEGRILGLDYATVDDKNSFVSFSSMIFH